MVDSASNASRILQAHAAFGLVAACILVPASLLLARFGRTWSRWAMVHWIINTATVVFVCIAVALAHLGKDKNKRAEPAHHVHPGLGSVVLVVVVLQAAVGIIAKRVKPPEFNYVTLQPGRHRVRLFHIGAGIIIAALLYCQCYTGFDYWSLSAPNYSMVPHSIRTAFWIVVAVEIVLYFAGWPLMEVIGRNRRARLEGSAPRSGHVAPYWQDRSAEEYDAAKDDHWTTQPRA